MASIPAEGSPSDQSLFFSFLVNHHFADGESERTTQTEMTLGRARAEEKEGRDEPCIAERQ